MTDEVDLLFPLDGKMTVGEEGGAGREEGGGKNDDFQHPWKVLVIDDDPDVHPLTQMVLKKMRFQGRPLQFINGYSGADARRLLMEHPDTAILLLDVVMESDQEGLEVVRHVREELKNPFIRIILRTGQPGSAPESHVIANFDIDDYKDKVSMSSQKLITSVTSCLRAFNLLRTIENTRVGLKKIIQATSRLYEPNSLGQLATGILTQLAALISHDDGKGSDYPVECFAATEKHGLLNIYAAFGKYEGSVGAPVSETVGPEVMAIVKRAEGEKRSVFTERDYLGFFQTRNGMENLIYLRGHRQLNEVDRDLIEVFSSSIASAFEQLFLNRAISKTQKDVTFTLGEIIEARSEEAGQHVRRVAESSRLLAQLAGLSADEVEMIWIASPMHDLGKIGIPDAILNKPGKLTDTEWQTMQNHTRIGYQVLESNDQEIIRTGGIICAQHHEKWDGSGYPAGLKGEEIHIFARITALIDVFDALTHERAYKRAWSTAQALDLIKKERGSHFEPRLVDLFLANISDFLDIQKAFAEIPESEAPADSPIP
ncbi:MAG: DUF3369 domain-containing protein [Magnetococcales bacterium]|nr:DUF3369 domain-containing protein [Magnetococcales bacterium]